LTMKSACPRRLFVALALTWALVFGANNALGEPPANAVEFNRDVRPILSNYCFTCHGPDSNNRKANLRLDVEHDAFADRGGYAAFVPGKPAKSEAYRRLTSKNKKEQMPPHKLDKKLKPHEIEVLRQWIEQGAKWQKHWSLIAPQRPLHPNVADKSWPRNP